MMAAQSPLPGKTRDGAEGTADVHREPVGPDDDPAPSYAGFVTRAIALTLDAGLIDVVALAATGAALLVASVFSVSGKHHPVATALGAALFVIWLIAYFLVFWTTTGQTPGSRVMQIRVVRVDGTRLRPRHALARLAGMALSLPLVWGYLPILTSARRRGVCDVIAGTVVTVVRPTVPENPRYASIDGRRTPPRRVWFAEDDQTMQDPHAEREHSQ
jgi:uncharacterized RDD family membrane protein YckC